MYMSNKYMYIHVYLHVYIYILIYIYLPTHTQFYSILQSHASMQYSRASTARKKRPRCTRFRVPNETVLVKRRR